MELANKNIFSNIRGDIFGGITAGVIALPLALAFGVASGVGAAAGLYGAIMVGLFAAIFGGTKTQISGPTGPMTVVLASIIVTHPGNINAIFLSIFLAGLIQILFGITKLGTFIKYVPYPVISGFMSGIGTIIVLLQAGPLLGLSSSGSTFECLKNLVLNISNTNLHALFLGLLTLLIVFFTPKKIAKVFPPALIALISVTIISILFKFNVPTISDIPASLPAFKFPTVSLDIFKSILPIAFTLAILGSVDSLLTSLVADSITKTKHDSNKELIGQGIGNMMASLFGGIAGAGATMRTVVNVKAGGRTQLSGVVHSLFLIAILLGAAPLAKNIPNAVLAGILIKVGVDIVDYKFLKVINNAPKRDLFVMLWVYFVTVFYDLIFAVGTGIVLSAILFSISIAQQFNIQVDDMYPIDEDENSNIEEKSKYAIRVVDVKGILFFGSSSQMVASIDDTLGTKYLIISCEQISTMDISAAFSLEDMILNLKTRGITVILVLRNEKIKRKLLDLGTIDILGKDNVFFDRQRAINEAELRLNNSTNK
jgi:SulP family sulfate permease